MAPKSLDKPFDVKEDDILILVLGGLGAGKSTFIKEYAKVETAIGHKLASDKNSSISCHATSIPSCPELVELQGRRLLLVDTPGIDDTAQDQISQLKRISRWLATSLKGQRPLIAILWLVDINDKRYHHSEPDAKALMDLCGEDSLKNMVVATTQWDAITASDAGEKRELDMQTKYWKGVLDKSAQAMRIEKKPEHADNVIKHLLSKCLEIEQERPVPVDTGIGTRRGPGPKIPKSRAWEKQKKDGDLTMEDANSNDLVIMVMGPTGVGKSTFINTYLDQPLAGRKAQVGHDLEACTRNLEWYTQQLGPDSVYSGRRLILVDTPGFDATYGDECDILRRIGIWLSDSYVKGMTLAGVVYLHDINQRRMFGSARINLSLFEHLIGHNAFSTVALATCQWDRVTDNAECEKREAELKEGFWATAIADGATVFRLDTPESHKRIVETILKRRFKARAQGRVLLIQKELVEKEKFIPMTSAGQQLKYTLEELLETQRQLVQNAENDEKRRELTAKVARTQEQLESLSVSLRMKFSAWFHDLLRWLD